MKNATELLQSYLDNIRNPAAAAGLFAEDGVLELPWVKAHVQGPAAIEGLITGLLARIPDFGFKNLRFWIQTPDRVFAEYQVEALVLDTGKTYRQTYAGVLIAENGRIKLLREALDTVEAARALGKEPQGGT
jgi:ketosteroid isomerase-like protein